MAKETHRDTVDCLLSELKDAYEGLSELAFAKNDYDIAVGIDSARASLERAYQLVSDLKAAQP